MRDYDLFKKYELNGFIVKETENLCVPTRDFKSVESKVNAFLKDNKKFDIKLFNESYISQNHYIIFRK